MRLPLGVPKCAKAIIYNTAPISVMPTFNLYGPNDNFDGKKSCATRIIAQNTFKVVKRWRKMTGKQSLMMI
jgi:hypothetical protein